MKSPAQSRKILFLAPLVALWACGDDSRSGTGGPAEISTLAYVLTECNEHPKTGYTAKQKLLVRQGDGDPVTVAEVPAVGPLLLDRPLCWWWGNYGWGTLSTVAGAFHRLGVSPDGSLVIFEVTDDFSLASQNQVPPEQEGIFVVRADGSGLRRLGPASRNASFRVNHASFLVLEVDPWFFFDAAGLRVAFTDVGPGPDGNAPQVFTMELATGDWHQVTHLPLALGVEPGRLALRTASFLDEETIVFASFANPVIGGEDLNPGNQFRTFSVKTAVTTEDPNNATQLRVVPFFADPDNVEEIIDAFQITGPEPSARILAVEGSPTGGGPCYFGDVVLEAFVLDSERVLQLTNFRRCDTAVAAMSADRQRIFFYASADPLGTNPCKARSIFSIDRAGGDLRQLIGRHEGEPSQQECDQARDCTVPTDFVNQDPLTGSLLFTSTCDLLGTNPNLANQIFAMRPDGTGLRQLTFARGLVWESDGSRTVENPGPWNCTVLPR